MAPGRLTRISRGAATAFVLAMLVSLQPANANECQWKNGDGNFRKGNWNNCSRPKLKDNVYIGRFPYGPATVTINQDEEFHDLHLDYGSTLDMNSQVFIHGNLFQLGGTLNLTQTSNLHPYFRSYSKDLKITAEDIGGATVGGTINLDNGNLGGNMEIGAGITVQGAGQIGLESELLFSDGTIRSIYAGKEILFQHSIDGQGRYESTGGGTLHFTAPSSGDYLVNNGYLQLDADFTVAKDYSGALTNGNIFDPRRNVFGTGRILAADARQVVSGPKLAGNVVNFGAMRVNGSAATTLTVTNAGGETTLRGAVESNTSLLTLQNFIFGLTPGASQTAILTFSGKTAGAYDGQLVSVVNNFDNVDDNYLLVHANVYAPAVASIPVRTVDFGTVRKGTAGA